MKKRYYLLLIILLVRFNYAAAVKDNIKSHNNIITELSTAVKNPGGIAVFTGMKDIKTPLAFAKAMPGFIVQVLLDDYADVEKQRNRIAREKACGRLSIDLLYPGRLPYTSGLVNLLVVGPGNKIPGSEIIRVLVPGGTALIDDPKFEIRNRELYSHISMGGSRWTKILKPRPNTIDEWTHHLHGPDNNAVARDKAVGPPQSIQWMEGPRWSRSHENDSSMAVMVSARGRIFYIYDKGPIGVADKRFPAKWSLIARDAFNGALLWDRPVPAWGWQEWKPDLRDVDWKDMRSRRAALPLALPRRLVVEEDRVYVTLGYHAPVSLLEANTGRIIKTYKDTEWTDEIIYYKEVLYLCIRNKSDKPRGGTVIKAVDSKSGRIIWESARAQVSDMSMAVSENYVVYDAGESIIALDRSSGSKVWSSTGSGKEKNKSREKKKNSSMTLVIYKNIVLILNTGELAAFSLDTGKMLWNGKGGIGPGIMNPPDLFVAKGSVWLCPTKKLESITIVTGLDPFTGKPMRTLNITNLITPGHHARCYRGKATENYLLWPKRGVEFLDLDNRNHSRHDYVRGGCGFGFLPCNGMLYMSPHPCFCNHGVQLNGFIALTAGNRFNIDSGPLYSPGRSTVIKPETSKPEWPMYRHDPLRSGSASCRVPADLNMRWELKLGGKLAQPIAAGSKLYVTRKEAGQVCCIDADNGKEFWRVTVGSRIDSPPVYYKGLLIFGSDDGHVYCYKAEDGKMVWRFRAAPEDSRISAYGRITSRWPVHGSVLVKDDLIYCTAGRSSYLDNGILFYALEPLTGKVVYKNRLTGPKPGSPKKGYSHDMEGFKTDILVSDGKDIFLYHNAFNYKLEKLNIPRISDLGVRKFSRHIFATAGFLDDSWFNRNFWMHTEYWPGFNLGSQSSKAGQILVFDNKKTYGVKCFIRRNKLSPLFFPQTDGYIIFADYNDTEPVRVDNKHKPDYYRWLPEITRTDLGKNIAVGFARTKPPVWMKNVPVRVLAMVICSDKLFAAGPPDLLDPEDPLASFEGRKGGILKVLDANSGKHLAEYELETMPVFDGMIAAHERLYISTADGRVLCYHAKK